MSGWGWNNLFGGSAAAKKDAPKNAILRLRSTLEMLSKREKHLQNQMDEQDAIARKNVAANKASKCHAATLISGMEKMDNMLIEMRYQSPRLP